MNTSISKHQIHMQFILYALVGICATAAQYMTLISLMRMTALHAATASTVGMVIGSVVSYYLNHRLTFQSTKRHHHALVQFYIIAAVATALNALFMYIGVSQLHLHYMTAQVISTILVLFWNFTCNRLWTFRI